MTEEIAKFVQNTRAASRGSYPFQHILSLQNAQHAYAEVRRCPVYAAAPLLSLQDAAVKAGVAEVLYKDESSRFGLDSFKALGGAYAVGLLLREKVEGQLGRPVSLSELVEGRYRSITKKITVACATDGNHGRAVASGARLFGSHCAIFLHQGVSRGRAEAIMKLGADVIRTTGDYDDSVRAAAQATTAEGWELVSDTSWPGYESVPAHIMQGYTVLVIEILEQLRASDKSLPTHVFLQGGVGGLAAAVVAHFWEALQADAPVFIIVEPERADCLYQSAISGKPMRSSGDLDTVMAGLACGEVSTLAWKIIERGAEFFMTISDEAAIDAMVWLGRRKFKIVAGESATAGLAGFLRAASDPECRSQMRLNADSRILVIGTEGATDPEIYNRLVADAASEPAIARASL